MSHTNPHADLAIRESFRPEYLLQYRIIPLELTAASVKVGAVGVPNESAVADLRQLYGREPEILPLSQAELEAEVKAAFASESVEDLVRALAAGSETDRAFAAEDTLADARDLASQPPVIKFVNLLCREAAAAGASDIHLEHARGSFRVRLRIDGVLSDLPSPPVAMQVAVISRIKLLAELDIAERRVPQDGRIRLRLDERELDLRASTMPTLHGESVVLRLLDRGGRPSDLCNLGMPSSVLGPFLEAIGRAHGIVLATGPTGSGKTTTLYAAVSRRRPSVEKIVTVEDPVEYRLEGITQIPINTKAGLTFPAALRSILRQDPDVLLIGEMRDPETAGIAVQAAMTGHLVFSTVHTNDALSTVDRLVDLGVAPYLVAATVEGILAQRLVRRLCNRCSEPRRADQSALAIADGLLDPDAEVRRAVGCVECRGTGYRGRVGVFEYLPITDDLRHVIARRGDRNAFRPAAEAAGWLPLATDAWHKVAAGLSTPEEVLRVIGTN